MAWKVADQLPNLKRRIVRRCCLNASMFRLGQSGAPSWGWLWIIWRYTFSSRFFLEYLNSINFCLRHCHYQLLMPTRSSCSNTATRPSTRTRDLTARTWSRCNTRVNSRNWQWSWWARPNRTWSKWSRWISNRRIFWSSCRRKRERNNSSGPFTSAIRIKVSKIFSRCKNVKLE